MPQKHLYTHIKSLYGITTNRPKFKAGKDMADFKSIDNAWLLVSENGTIENFGEIYSSANGKWNDLPENFFLINSAVVEYDGTPNLHITANSSIDVGTYSQTIIETPPAPRIAPGVTTIEKAALTLQKII